MKQVYLANMAKGSNAIQVFSSRWKAIAHFNRALCEPDFEQDEEITTVSVAGSTVGWITKKFVQ